MDKKEEEVVDKKEDDEVAEIKEEVKEVVKEQVKEEAEKQEEVKEAAKHEVGKEWIYLYLKGLYMQAKLLHVLKDYVKADDLCDEIIDYIDSKQEVETYFKFAVKALYIKSKQQSQVMEFRKALAYLAKEALPLLTKLNGKFAQPGLQADEEKDLQDNRYAFQYWLEYSIYLKKFAFYESGINQLKKTLED